MEAFELGRWVEHRDHKLIGRLVSGPRTSQLGMLEYAVRVPGWGACHWWVQNLAPYNPTLNEFLARRKKQKKERRGNAR